MTSTSFWLKLTKHPPPNHVDFSKKKPTPPRKMSDYMHDINIIKENTIWFVYIEKIKFVLLDSFCGILLRRQNYSDVKCWGILRTSRTSKMRFFAKKTLTIFAKSSILDLLLGSAYASGMNISNTSFL